MLHTLPEYTHHTNIHTQHTYTHGTNVITIFFGHMSLDLRSEFQIYCMFAEFQLIMLSIG